MDNAGRWYLVGEHRGRPHTYRVSRVAGVEILAAPSRVRSHGSVHEIWDGLRSSLERSHEPTEILVGVAPEAAGRMRRLLSMQLAPGTSIAEEWGADGRLLWRLAVRQSDVISAMAVMAAPDLTVLEPIELRGAVRAAAERALLHYSRPASGLDSPRQN